MMLQNWLRFCSHTTKLDIDHLYALSGLYFTLCCCWYQTGTKVYDNVTRLVKRMAVGGGTKTRIYEVVRCTLAFTCPVGTQLVGQMSQKQQYHVQSVYEKTINLTL